MKYLISAHTDKGLVREKNEDNYIVCPDLGKPGDWFYEEKKEYHLSPEGFVLAVADGMGGAMLGEVASKIAVDSIRQYFSDKEHKSQKESDLIKKAIFFANDAIVKYIQDHPEAEGMGTTLVISYTVEKTTYIGWVGDSRFYLIRGKNLIRVSKDHSLVQGLVDNGTISESEAFYHPQNNIITQCLGQMKTALDPGFIPLDLCDGDILLLCTDGLSSYVRESMIEKICAMTDFDLLSQSLINESLANGGNDNVTVIVARIGEVGRNAERANRRMPQNKHFPLWSIFVLGLFLIISGALMGYFLPHLFTGRNGQLNIIPKDTTQKQAVQPFKPSALKRDSTALQDRSSHKSKPPGKKNSDKGVKPGGVVNGNKVLSPALDTIKKKTVKEVLPDGKSGRLTPIKDSVKQKLH
jgi:PPM family protein phosphatase